MEVGCRYLGCAERRVKGAEVSDRKLRHSGRVWSRFEIEVLICGDGGDAVVQTEMKGGASTAVDTGIVSEALLAECPEHLLIAEMQKYECRCSRGATAKGKRARECATHENKIMPR